MRAGAKALIYDQPERLHRIIMTEMLKLSNLGIIPTWGHYKSTHHWIIVQKYLNAEEQFQYRRTWQQILRNTFPGATPEDALPSHVTN